MGSDPGRAALLRYFYYLKELGIVDIDGVASGLFGPILVMY